MGEVIAPEGKVDLKKEVTFRGSICAEEIKVARDGVYAFHDSGTSVPLIVYEAASVGSTQKGDEPDAREVEGKQTDDASLAGVAETADEAETTDEAEADGHSRQAAAPAYVETAAEVPAEYTLHTNYPNPFNPVTTIRFGLPEAAQVRLIVYDMLGRQVRVLVDGTRKAGTHEVSVDAAACPAAPISTAWKRPPVLSSRRCC